MKIIDSRPTIESSGDMIEESFSIENTGMIFDILRNKMYADPIRAICREISSNARDAHREVGKGHVPCQITLPSTFSAFYKIKDFGPGISPDRITNIFIKYTASTKRGDNLQTGGFGLGAKTPFSYSDAFTIETVFEGMRYCYSCFIDETKVGKIVCMTIEPTTEENSTEITIPVKPIDYRKFAEDTEYVTRHWEVKPIIKGGTINYKTMTATLTGNGYCIAKSNNYDVLREVKLIIDGIEYPLDTNQLKNFAAKKVLTAANGTVYLYFNVGELSLSATRESVHLDDATQNKIAGRLQRIVKDFTDDVIKQIATQPTLWDAQVWVNNQLQHTFSDTSFLGPLTWKNKPLTLGRLEIKNAEVFIFEKGRRTTRGNTTNKIHKSTNRFIDFVNHSAIYLCDLSLVDVQVKNISKAFADDANLKYIYVVRAKDTFNIKDIAKDNNLVELGAKDISSITKVSKTYNISGVRLLVFKFASDHTFRQVSYAQMEEDTNSKIICSLSKDNYQNKRQIILNKKHVDNSIIQSIMEAYPKHSIYGVDDSIPKDKVEEHFSDFTTFENFIEKKFVQNQNFDFAKIKYAHTNRYDIDNRYMLGGRAESSRDKVLDSKSLFLKYLDLIIDLKKAMNKDLGALNIFELFKGEISDTEIKSYLAANPSVDFQSIKSKVEKQYPLINHTDYYNASKEVEPYIHYINLIDKEIKSLV